MSCCHSTVEDHPAKRIKTTKTTATVDYDDVRVEFPVGDGQCIEDYCPIRCTICLMGILKRDAKAGPCVTHVFHETCIDTWTLYLIQMDRLSACPTCMNEHKECINAVDEETNGNKGSDYRMV